MTDVATPTPSAPAAVRPKPVFKALAAAVLVAMVIGIGTAAWYALQTRTPVTAATDFVPDPGPPEARVGRGFPRIMGGGQRATAARPAGVTVMPGRVVTIRGEGVTASANGRPNGSWRVTFVFDSGPVVDREVIRLQNERRRITDQRNPPAALKLTAVQRTALAAMPDTPAELDAANGKRLVELLAQLDKAGPNTPASQPIKDELLALVTTVGKADRNAIKAEYARRDAQVRQILSPEQVQMLLNPGVTPAPTPVPTPAAAGA